MKQKIKVLFSKFVHFITRKKIFALPPAYIEYLSQWKKKNSNRLPPLITVKTDQGSKVTWVNRKQRRIFRANVRKKRAPSA